MAKELRLAAEVAKQVRLSLKHRYPDITFSVKAKSWSLGGSVDVRWIDGPTSKAIDALLKPYKTAHEGIIYVGSERSFSHAFLTNVTLAYCRAFGYALPDIKTREDGTAYVAQVYVKSDELGVLVWREASKIDAEDRDNFTFKENDQGDIVLTSLVLKQDYGKGMSEHFAIIGRQGYALMSGPNVWFDIYKVERRHGAHRVRIVHGTGMGYFFNSTKDAQLALNQLTTTGEIRLLCTDGKWHY